MKLGIHAYAWHRLWLQDPLRVLERAKEAGFDFVEVPLMELDRLDVEALAQKLRSLGLEACTSTVLTQSTDITSDDPGVRRNGVRYLEQCVLAASRLGARLVSGVVYGPHAKRPASPPAEAEWQRAADALREVARFARDHGVELGLEPVNRYESHLVNTCEQALRLCEMVGEPNVKVHLDTYHMNIEEKDFYAAAIRAGDRLVHLHLSENDRGIPGTGLVRWDDLFRALAAMGYRGMAAIESFADMAVPGDVWAWRAPAPDTETLVRQGSRFIRGLMQRYGLAA